METHASYLDRKCQEISLLNGCLGRPLTAQRPTSVAEVIEQKFQLAAALKAEHAAQDWALTETAWAHRGRLHAGPFAFNYDYQRADLDVRGPSFYDMDDAAGETIYTASGMGAISTLLQACSRLMSRADILVMPGSYGETIELINSYARQLRRIAVKDSLDEVGPAADRPRILLLDSSARASAFEATLRSRAPALDLVIFDTTCFAGGSGRIRRVLSRVRRWQVPLVLVRSHTKLDSLGLEYGRLGSATFIAGREHDGAPGGAMARNLRDEMRNAVRLFGCAAVPAHFPPYVGTPTYRKLTSRRVAAILRNSRRTARYFSAILPHAAAELHFAHGLYVTLAPRMVVGEKEARQIATELCNDLGKAGMPICHAGSFGFDFGAAEWFHDATDDRYLVRIAVPDLPTPLWDQVAQAIADWWRHKA